MKMGKQINKKAYTLLLLRTVAQLNKDILEFTEKNSDLIVLSSEDPFKILLTDKQGGPAFTFSIANPQQSKDSKIIFDVSHIPSNTASLVEKKTKGEAKIILSLLEQWGKLIRAYSEIELTPEGRQLVEYEQEFYDKFELLDGETDTQYYDLETQVVISNYFTTIVKALRAAPAETEELIEVASGIKDNVTNMTKKATVKRISRFFALLRKKGLPFFKEIISIGKQEIYKRAISGGINTVIDIADGIF